MCWLCNLVSPAYGEGFSPTANMLPYGPPKSQLHIAGYTAASIKSAAVEFTRKQKSTEDSSKIKNTA